MKGHVVDEKRESTRSRGERTSLLQCASLTRIRKVKPKAWLETQRAGVSVVGTFHEFVSHRSSVTARFLSIVSVYRNAMTELGWLITILPHTRWLGDGWHMLVTHSLSLEFTYGRLII